MKMKNETALITGGSSGIGNKIAELFLKQGCKVAICSSNAEKIKRATDEFAEFGDNVFGAKCDVTNPAEVKQFVSDVKNKFGSIRILVANAGVSVHYGPFYKLDPETANSDAHKTIGVNLIGVLNIISEVMPVMIEQKYGRIITLTGGGADRPIPYMTIYSSTKAGVQAFSRCFAEELKELNAEQNCDIKINIFQPGMQKTGLTSKPKIVPNWKSEAEIEKQMEIVMKYIGGDLTESCSKVIPYALPACSENGKIIRGIKVSKIIRGAIKMRKEMKKIEN